MRLINYLFLFILCVSCFETDEEESGTVYDGHTQSTNLLSVVNPNDPTYYVEGETFYVVLSFPGTTTVIGVPDITIDIGGNSQTATFYDQGEDSSELWFECTVGAGDFDSDGIGVTPLINLNGGTIRYQTTFDVNTVFTDTGASNLRVDAITPTLTTTNVPAGDTYEFNDALILTLDYDEAVYVYGAPRISFDLGGVTQYLNYATGSGTSTLTFSEAVDVVGGTPRIGIDVGGSTLYADYQSGTGTTDLLFRYTVGTGDTDIDGITLISPFELNGATIRDSGSRDAFLTFTRPNTSFVNVDGVAPAAPIFSSWNPESPSDNTTPFLSLTTDAYATVTLYSDASCSTEIKNDTASSGGTITMSLSSLSVGINSIWVAATDLAGNHSVCSASSYDYEVYQIPEGMGWFQAINTTFGTDLNQLNTLYSMSWDTYRRYDSSYYSYSTSNPERVTVLQSGDYKLSFNLPLDLASTAQRATIQATVLVNGVVQDEAISESNYIRNSSGHDETSTSMTILLNDLSINDYIEVQVQGRTVTGVVNTLEAASLHLDYIGDDSVFYGKATRVTGGADLNNSADSLEWSQVKLSSSFTHSDSSNPQNITLTENGDYLVYVNVPMNSSVARAAVKISVQVNGVTVDGGVAAQGYIRATSNHNNTSVHWSGVLNGLSALDVITVITEQEAVAGTVTVQSGKNASLLIHKVETSTNTIAVRGNNVVAGTNWNQNSISSVQWDIQDTYDATFFNHDPFSANPENITIQSNGDYLLIFNGAFTSTAPRANLKIQVYVNGVAVSGGIGASAYIRASSGHNEGSSAYSHYLKDLKIGDIVTIESIRESNSGTVTTIVDARLFIINYPF